jgi:hypothetical protein
LRFDANAVEWDFNVRGPNVGGAQATFADMTSNGQMRFVVGTYDGTTLRIYVDGVEGTPAAFDDPWGDKRVTLAATRGAGTSVTEPFDGILCNVCIFDRALSQDEILTLFSAGVPGPA